MNVRPRPNPDRPSARRHDLGRSRLAVPAVLAVAKHPRLWPILARLTPPGWWRRWPPNPLPPPDYIRFRTQTMYGDGGRLDPQDLIAYLEWCRRMGSQAR
jgi:hypothetical protein